MHLDPTHRKGEETLRNLVTSVAAGDRGSGAGVGDPVQAVADDPFPGFLQREDGRQGARDRPTVDILLGNLEDAVPADRKVAARDGLVRVGKEMELGDTQLWTRVNSLESPWVLDDLTTWWPRSVTARRHMVPKVEVPGHPLRRPSACAARGQGRARASDPRARPARDRARSRQRRSDRGGVAADAGDELWPGRSRGLAAHEDTRVGGGHPGYRVLGDPDPDAPDAPRPSASRICGITRSAHGRCLHLGRILPFYGRSATSAMWRLRGAVPLSLPARCVGAWSLHPAQIEIAKRVFSPDPDEVAFAKRVLEAIPTAAACTCSTARCRTTRPGSSAGDGLAGADARRQGRGATRRLRILSAADCRRRASGRVRRNTGAHMRISAKADMRCGDGRARCGSGREAGPRPSASRPLRGFLELPREHPRGCAMRRRALAPGAEGGFRLAKDASKISVCRRDPRCRGATRERPAPRRESQYNGASEALPRVWIACARTCAVSSTSPSLNRPASSPRAIESSPTIRTSGSRADRSVFRSVLGPLARHLGSALQRSGIMRQADAGLQLETVELRLQERVAWITLEPS